MLQENKVDKYFAVIVFIAGFITYWSSMAPTTSFWDCGEFIACSYTMAVPHPPGSPLFLLWGRFFTLLPFAADIGYRMNMISVLCSSFSLLFTYLTIVRLIRIFRGRDENIYDSLIVGCGGLIGTLALGFSYSFWFNSVEAEVYSASTLLTALVFWLILKWTDYADEPKGDKIILFIAYIIGLATGVHLLNLLAIFALALIVYFHKNEFKWQGFLITMALAAAGFFVVYPGVVKYIPQMMQKISPWAPLIVIFALIAALRWVHQNRRRFVSIALMSILLVILGYSTYATIYIRSQHDPNIDENNPDNLDRLVYYLNREQYGDAPILNRRWNNNPEYTGKWDFFWRYQVHHMYTRYFLWQFVGRDGTYQDAPVTVKQFWALPLLLGLIGMAHHFQRDGKRAFTVLTLFFITGYAIILYLNQEDPQPRERDYSYVGSFYAFALWIGIGASHLIETGRKVASRASPGLKKAGVFGTAALLLAVVPFNMLLQNYNTVKRTGNYIAWDYSYNILESCAPDGIIFTNGDNDTFPLWYLQEVEKIRTDVRVANLSLLNTGWYIKQLKNWEPKVLISFSDDYIDRYIDGHDIEALKKRYWPNGGREIIIESPEGNYQWFVPATMYIPVADQADTKNNFLRVQDLMILNIIATNKGQKPIYFAVTVSNSNMTGLKDYLTMEGLVFRLNPDKGKLIDPDLMRVNLFETYADHYRNLDNPKVHYDDNIVKLLQNYRSAFLQLAYHYYTRNKPGWEPGPEVSIEERYANFDSLSSKSKVELILDKMSDIMPEDVLPLNNNEITVQIGRMYYDIGRPDELSKRLDRLSAADNVEEMIRYSVLYSKWLNDKEKASRLLDKAMEKAVDKEMIIEIATLISEAGEPDRAMTVLQEILAGNPPFNTKLRVAAAYYQMNRDTLARNLYKQLVAVNSADGEAVGGLLSVYHRMGEIQEAHNLLEEWLKLHPNDAQAKQRLQEYKNILSAG